MSATASFPQQTAGAERHVIPLSAVFVPQGENQTPRVWALNKDGTVSSVAVVLGSPVGVNEVQAAGLSPPAVLRLWQAFQSGARGLYWSRIWAIFVLVRWCQRHGVRR